MFRSLFSKKNPPPVRQLDSVLDLQVGDIIKFKPRSLLPVEVQGMQCEVKAVSTYQYDGELSKELQLLSEDNKTFYLAIDDNDGSPELALSLKISRNSVLSLFDEEQFAELWQEHFPELQVQEVPEHLEGWVSDYYKQETKEAEAYFYNYDCTQKGASRFKDDDSQELRYHECIAEDDRYALSVEVWADGTTDVALVVYTPVDVIAEFWPKVD